MSNGAEANQLGPVKAGPSRMEGSPINPTAPFIPGAGFLAYNFDDNATETGGFLFIPPDPCGAAGTDRVLAVVNVGIECRTKAGVLIFRDALRDFFSPLGGATLGTFTFDPKVVWDHYENRFVVVSLEQTAVASGDPADASRILVAVSKTATPATATAADWWYLAIDSKVNIGGTDHWADYPGFEVDEEAVYITNNMFPFAAGPGGTRLWIIDKGVVGGFYAGLPAAWAIYNPIPAGFFDMTMQPALVFGAGGAGAGIGTYLVGYSGLTFGGVGGLEAVQVIRVDNPLGVPVFTAEFVTVGDLEDIGGVFGFPALPDAPQSGSPVLIEVNDRRALDAVWRDNSLWFTTTIEPNVANDPNNVGETTAHWFRLDTSAVPGAPITVFDQGNIGGNTIAPDAYTFFPSVAVNILNDAKFGFACSAAQIFCGAYFAGREEGIDPPGATQAPGIVQVGLDWYWRQFSGTRNRWGDYTGAAVDPIDDLTFWIFNEYAEIRGTPTAGQDGRWGTAWRQCLKELDYGDAKDPLYPTLFASNGARHPIRPGVMMGALIDAEPDGIPSALADGDDTTNLPDEDGVAFVTPLIPGVVGQVNVTVSVDGWLDAFFDFNQNGSWLDPGELVYSGLVFAGLNLIPVPVPAVALPGNTFSRFRFNIGLVALAPTGLGPDGEVEDYPVVIEQEELDFGDAPDPAYPTLLASNGARHTIQPGVMMGVLIDAEPDGIPTPLADGDDTTNLPDEDGVAFVTPLIPGVVGVVNVTVSIDGWLDAFFDFNQNGSWLDPGELVYSGPVFAGVNPIPVPVPAVALLGNTFARFRFNVALVAQAPTGLGPDGEVEDYLVVIEQEQEEIDYGDAPDPTYRTLMASGGASHVIIPGFFMGATIDGEPDGQPHPAAQGDDLGGVDDEDGVTFTTPLSPTNPAGVSVIASAPGLLDAWIDFDANGVFDASDQIFASTPLVPGVNPLIFPVPPTGTLAFVTYARFRFSMAGGLGPDLAAPDGEVEDYQVFVEDDLVTGADDRSTPKSFALYEPVPNPFNPQTTLSFALPTASTVKLTVYDVRGHVVATLLDEERGPGIHSVVWDGTDNAGQHVASGVYLYRLEAGTFVETKRMVLVK